MASGAQVPTGAIGCAPCAIHNVMDSCLYFKDILVKYEGSWGVIDRSRYGTIRSGDSRFIGTGASASFSWQLCHNVLR